MSRFSKRDRAADHVVDHRLAVVGDPQADRGARRPAAARPGSRRCRAPPSRRARRRRSPCPGRRARTRPARRSRSRWRSARSAWLSGPSSQSSSSQRSASRICSTFSGVERSRSVSSIRSTSAPPAAPREEPVVECRARAADVQDTGRRRGEADSRGLVHHVADRRACFHSGRPGQRGRARRRVEVRRDPDLQPEPADVAPDTVLGRRLRRISRGDRGVADRLGDDPRRLPDQLREQGARDPHRSRSPRSPTPSGSATGSAPTASSCTPALARASLTGRR